MLTVMCNFCMFQNVIDIAYNGLLKTRNSAIADKPHNAFRGQSRSPNMVPFNILCMVSY